MVVDATARIHIQRQIELCATLMVLRFALASARLRAPLLALASARVRLPATHAITVRGAPHFLRATRGVFAVRRFTVAPAPLGVPLLVGVADRLILRASAGTLGMIDDANGFVAERLQVLRHNLNVGDVAGHASLVGRFVNAH